ncbi:hypothetical protein L1887_05458 [Cichorium endivia]|nr:hypothetical protein L1887_05458 [Cichorium endivia]
MLLAFTCSYLMIKSSDKYSASYSVGYILYNWKSGRIKVTSQIDQNLYQMNAGKWVGRLLVFSRVHLRGMKQSLDNDSHPKPYG